MADLPVELRDVEATLFDFNTGEQLAAGRADVTFTRETDRLRVQRNLFEGEFRPASADELDYVEKRLLAALSQGAPAMTLWVEYGGETWAFVVKLSLFSETAFPFTGRAEPKLV
ncbi:MAG: hypothetical protein ABFE07_23745 [Armatimonadia bacterium]